MTIARRATLRAALLLPASALVPGCSGLGGTYLPSHDAARIADLDRAEGLPATFPAPVFVEGSERDALGRGTLGWLVANTLPRSPLVRQAYYGLASGMAAADLSGAQRGPSATIDARFGATDASGNEPSIRRDGAAGVAGSLTIFDGGAGRLREERARWQVASALAQAHERIEAVAYGVAEGYVGVMKARSGLALVDAEVRRFEHLLRQVRSLVAAGTSGAADAPEAEARVERIRQSRAQARQALGDAEARLLRLTGEPTGADPMVRPSDVPMPGSGEEIAVAAAASHPSVRAHLAEVRAAVKAALSVDAERFGAVVAQFGPSGFMQAFGGAGVLALGTAFLRLSLPIFDGGQRAARLRAAAADLEVALARREDASRSVAMSVRQAANARAAAVDISALAAREGRAAARLARAREADYRAGLADLRSVLDAEQATMEAAIKADGAGWDRTLATLRLLATAGGLAAHLGAVRTREVDLGDPDAFPLPTLLEPRPSILGLLVDKD